MDVRDIREEDFLKLDTLQGKIRFILQYAVLAPSTHNSQPWLFKVNENSCEVYLDSSLKLRHADPKGRDVHISIGCAIENLIIAAKYRGLFGGVSFGLFGKNKNKKIAELCVKNTEKIKGYKSLIREIKQWVNARGNFKKEIINTGIIEDVLRSADLSDINTDVAITIITDKKIIERLAKLTAKGLRLAHSSSVFRKEMSQWMNSSFSPKRQGVPGYALKVPVILSLIIPTLVRYFDLSRVLAKKNYESIASAPLVTLLSLQEDNDKQWVQVGRVAQRLMLEWHVKGYNTSIFVAAIEMGGLYKEVQQYLKNKAHIPQFLFVVGHIDSLHKPTPRHAIDGKIIE